MTGKLTARDREEALAIKQAVDVLSADKVRGLVSERQFVRRVAALVGRAKLLARKYPDSDEAQAILKLQQGE